jgi:hypothetical protein
MSPDKMPFGRLAGKAGGDAFVLRTGFGADSMFQPSRGIHCGTRSH